MLSASSRTPNRVSFRSVARAHVPEPPGRAPDQEPEMPPISPPDEGVELPPREAPAPVRDPEEPARPESALHW